MSYVISYVGAGGKTGSIYRRAGELLARGQRVLITTTTHMYVPEPDRGAFVDCAGKKEEEVFAEVKRVLERDGICTVGACLSHEPEKFGAPGDALLEKVCRLADTALIEADGAAHMAAKVPAEHEPAVAPFTDEVVIVMGLAVVFIGIFITMAPTMMYLNEHAADMGLNKPWHFYYCAGALSSFLDNAPTAIAFHGVAAGLDISREAAAAGIVNGVFEGTTFVAGIPEILLKAVAIGSVFFGSMTYIGNGPNFMIKSIAEESGIKMPSFFGYMIKFSLIVLLPIYILTQLLFLH